MFILIFLKILLILKIITVMIFYTLVTPYILKIHLYFQISNFIIFYSFLFNKMLPKIYLTFSVMSLFPLLSLHWGPIMNA